MLIVSSHRPVRGWLSDAVRILGHVRVVTSGESEALRAVQILQADLAIIDCFGLTEDEHAALIASLESLSAEQSLPLILYRWSNVTIFSGRGRRQPPLSSDTPALADSGGVSQAGCHRVAAT